MSPDPRPDPGPEEQPHEDEGTDLARVIARGLAGRTRPGGAPRPSGRTGRRDTDPVRRTGDASSWSGARPDDRDPQTLDTGLERLVADRGWTTELRVHGVFSRWAAIVGPDIAAHSSPEAYAEGRLVVRATSTAWATQLTFVAATLVRRVNDELGGETVRVVDVLGPHGPSWRRGRLRVKGRGPRDTYG